MRHKFSLVLISLSLLTFKPADAQPTFTEYPLPNAASNPTGIVVGPDANLWVAEGGGRIARVTSSGSVTEFAVGASAQPGDIVVGPDGNLWYTAGASSIGRMTPSGTNTLFPVTSSLTGLASGSDGNLWATSQTGNKILKIAPSGTILGEIAIPTAASGLAYIAAGPDQNLWFTEAAANKIGRITTAGVITEYTLPFVLPGTNTTSRPTGITAGGDGALWFTEFDSARIGRISTAGDILELQLPLGTKPFRITKGPDNQLWYTQDSGVGRITTGGVVRSYNVPTSSAGTSGITSGPNNHDIWVTESTGNKIAKLAPVVGPQTGDFVFVPIVLSTSGAGGSFFTSEMTITNRADTTVSIRYDYTPSLEGGAAASGTATLDGGKQLIVPDAIEYLRGRGVTIPATGNRGGSLRVSFTGLATPGLVSVTVRTTTATSNPTGAAGLAYAGVPVTKLLNGSAIIPALRVTDADRSNVAVQNAGAANDGEVSLRVSVFVSDSATAVGTKEITLAPGIFKQWALSEFSSGSLSNAYARVERLSGSAPYYAYGVINDNVNSDGSFIVPVLESSLSGPTTGITLPVVVENLTFSTEVILTNLSTSAKTVRFEFVSSALSGGSAAVTETVAAGRQLVIPSFVQYLRDKGAAGVGEAGSATFVGSVFATVPGGNASGLVMGARTSNPGGGGRYGLFYGGVPFGSALFDVGYVYALQQNENNRSNLALINTGEVDGSSLEFEITVFDGDTGNSVTSTDTLRGKEFKQINTVLSALSPGTRNGFVRVTRTSGVNPFFCYGVVNDGGQPNQRSGDGAFIPGDGQ